MNRKSPHLPTLAAISLVALSLSNASAIQYTIDTGSVSGNIVDPGLVISTQLSKGVAGKTFILSDGESTTFDFFKIWTAEGSVENDDKQAKPITATLHFTDPFSSASPGGITFGGSTYYLLQSGRLVWSGPAIVTVGGLTYSVALSDVTFNTGVLSLTQGSQYGAVVTATVKQISSTVSVPDNGSTAMLLGLAFLSLGFIRRKKATVERLQETPAAV